jgi:hypothetical protein
VVGLEEGGSVVDLDGLVVIRVLVDEFDVFFLVGEVVGMIPV